MKKENINEVETWIDEMREHFSLMHGTGQAGDTAGYRGYG